MVGNLGAGWGDYIGHPPGQNPPIPRDFRQWSENLDMNLKWPQIIVIYAFYNNHL